MPTLCRAPWCARAGRLRQGFRSSKAARAPGIMVTFFLLLFFAIAIIGGLFWRWRKNVLAEIAEGAEIEWKRFQTQEPDFLKGLSREKFDEVYRRVHMPRFPAYALAAFATFAGSLPLTMALLVGLQWAGRATGILPEPVEVVRYVNLGEGRVTQSWQCDTDCQLYLAESYGGFYYFFGVLLMWLAIVAFFMRRYHARRPGYLRDEIIRARE